MSALASTLFLDSNIIIKYYITEPGSDWVRSIIDSNGYFAPLSTYGLTFALQSISIADEALMSFYNDLMHRLVRSNVDYHIHEHAPSVTVVDAETNLDFPVDQLLKTISFRIKNNGWVLAALCGHSQVDYKRLATFCGVSRDKLMRLTPAKVEQDLGVTLGAVAPFAPNAQTRVVIDTGAMQFNRIYCGTGRNDRTLEISPLDLVKIAGAAVAPLAKV